ncbi:hypothetical protein DFQ26_009341 [Actinomortierella ambigua]|nr:hypothetical protein DFQ26_009341 [Actinomortierella ambigua]
MSSNNNNSSSNNNSNNNSSSNNNNSSNNNSSSNNHSSNNNNSSSGNNNNNSSNNNNNNNDSSGNNNNGVSTTNNNGPASPISSAADSPCRTPVAVVAEEDVQSPLALALSDVMEMYRASSTTEVVYRHERQHRERLCSHVEGFCDDAMHILLPRVATFGIVDVLNTVAIMGHTVQCFNVLQCALYPGQVVLEVSPRLSEEKMALAGDVLLVHSVDLPLLLPKRFWWRVELVGLMPAAITPAFGIELERALRTRDIELLQIGIDGVRAHQGFIPSLKVRMLVRTIKSQVWLSHVLVDSKLARENM